MTSRLAAKLADAVAGTPLSPQLESAMAPLVERRSDDDDATLIEGPALRGLARVLATRPEWATFVSNRPRLLARIAALDRDSLARRGRELLDHAAGELGDLEADLDELRLLRREETLVAACVDYGGLAAFGAVSIFLSELAEAVVQRALRLAESVLPEAAARAKLSVIGMGKLAGREFTHHSDLDLIFLAEPGAAEVADASRLGQRLISYLTMMTGAGSAYAVDTRLRPSGHQGALVTSRVSFEHYQSERAELWEHLALMRSRAVAGRCELAEASLARVRSELFTRERDPWPYLADLRQRVVQERSDPSPREIHFKTGPGGLMDVDFLAGGALLERGAPAFPSPPSVRAMLQAVVPGPATDALLQDYDMLRVVESRARWMAGRGIETFATTGDALAATAELVRPGLEPGTLLEEVAAARRRIRGVYESVIERSSILALEAR